MIENDSRNSSTVATLALAGAAAVGANFVDVRNGRITPQTAITNGLIKGTAATAILARPPQTAGQTLFAVACLAAAGYTIDTFFKPKIDSAARGHVEEAKP